MDGEKSGLEKEREVVAESGPASKLWRAVADGDLDPKEVHPKRLPGCNRDDGSSQIHIDVC